LVLDVHMPGVSGFDVSVWMQTAGIQGPVIFITASDDATLDATVVENGVHLLWKPFPKQALLGAVEAALLRGQCP
jgi:FixJ family two-component response regulator